MGNLSLSNGASIDMKKAVISIWFRIPAATKAAANAAYNPSLSADYITFNGVIPLVTWGAQQTGAIYEWEFPTYEESPPGGGPPQFLGIGASITGSHTNKLPPSYIGVNCSGDDMYLEVQIQTANAPMCVNTTATVDDITADFGTFPITITYASSDASSTDAGTPEYFGNGGIAAATVSGAFGRPIIVGTDVWHHVILSWDLTGGSATHGSNSYTRATDGAINYTTAFSKMWVSIDDVNKSGLDLPATWIGVDTNDGEDANGVITSLCYDFAGAQKLAVNGNGPDDSDYQIVYGNPSVTTTVTSVPFSPVSFPSSLTVTTPTDTAGGNTTAAPNLQVDLARCHIFTGVTMDTSIEANRRAFVTVDGKAADPAAAQVLLGVAPRVLFKKSKDWITGKNSGTAGTFTHAGTIAEYGIDPGLGS